MSKKYCLHVLENWVWWWDVPFVPQQAERKSWLNNFSLILNKCVLSNRVDLDLAGEQCICLENCILLILEDSSDDQIKLNSGDSADALRYGYHCGLHGSR